MQAAQVFLNPSASKSIRDKKMKKLFYALTLLTVFTLADDLQGQGCCTVGSSTFGGMERGTTGDGRITLGLGFLTNNLNTAYDRHNSIADPLNRKALVSVYNFELEVGLTENVSLLFISGYSVKKRETTIFTEERQPLETIGFKGGGFSDITVIAKYALVSPTITAPFGVTIGGGAKLSVGLNNIKDSGTRLPIDLQPGSGSSDLLLWGNIYKGFPSKRFSISSSFFYRYPGYNDDGYRFGDEYVVSIMGEYYLLDYITLSSSFKSRFSNEDFSNGRFLFSTGGSYLDAVPGIIYYEGSAQLKLFYQLPLYRNVRGIQLTTSNAGGIEFLFSFN